MRVKDLIEYLTRSHSEEDIIAASLWTIGDVQSLAEQIGAVLTDGQAADVLEEAEHRFDANIGISWDVLEIHIKTVLRYGEGQG